MLKLNKKIVAIGCLLAIVSAIYGQRIEKKQTQPHLIS